MPDSPAAPEAPPRRRMSAADREQHILTSAVDYFSKHGLEAQTRDLAAGIGVTHALLYHYFPTKQALIERVYETVIEGRWEPRWEDLLDGPMPLEDKLCLFYREYLEAILTPDWLRIFMYSGMSDGLIPQRYFDLLRKKLFPRLLREVRKAHGVTSRAKATDREHALLMGLHGSFVYHLGVMPLCYGQGPSEPMKDPRLDVWLRDRIQAFLHQMGEVIGEEFPQSKPAR